MLISPPGADDSPSGTGEVGPPPGSTAPPATAPPPPLGPPPGATGGVSLCSGDVELAVGGGGTGGGPLECPPGIGVFVTDGVGVQLQVSSGEDGGSLGVGGD